MQIRIIVFIAAVVCVKIHALDLNAEAQKALSGVSKDLQRSQLIKTGPRLFNREVTPTMHPKPGDFWIGVVGDSSTTGAAAHPEFVATWESLLASTVAAPSVKDVLSPVRVMYSTAEFKAADHKHQAMELNIESDLSQKLDTEEYSFGAALARGLQLSSDKLVLTGQDGALVSAMAQQFRRLLEVGSPVLPPLVLVSFVANDLCHPDNFANPTSRFRERYEASLKAQLEQIATLPAAPSGTRVLILAPLDVASVLTNPNLLAQKVRMEGNKDVTCQQLREGQVGGNDFAKMMQNSLRGECRGVLAKSNNPAQHLAHLRELQEQQAAALKEATAAFNARNLPIKIQIAESVRGIDWQTGDLANDCFHPGKTGAEKIAAQLRAHELSDLK